MKLYYENIEFYHVLLFPLYLLLVYGMLLVISQKLLLKDVGFIKKYYGILIFVYSTLLLFDLHFDYIPFFPDTILYTDIIEGKSTLSNELPLELESFYFLSLLFSWVSMKSMILYLIFNLFINQIAIMMYWKAWKVYKNNNVKISEQRIYLLITSVYPLSVLYSLVPLRESFFVLGFSIFLFGLVYRKKNFYLLLGLLLIFLLRKEVFVLAILIVIIKMIVVRKNQINSKTLILIFALAPLLILIGNALSLKFLNIGISPNELANFRNYQRNSYLDSGMTYPSVYWNNWLDLILDVPGITMQFIYAPLPVIVNINFYSSVLYFVDALLMVVLTAILLLNSRWNLKNHFWWGIICIFLIISSLFEYYLLGAVRHRYFIVLMVFPVIAEGIIRRREYNVDRSADVYNGKKKYQRVKIGREESQY